MVGRAEHRTRADDLRFERLRTIGCIPCGISGWWTAPEIHHLLSGGQRRGHQFTVPLCGWHHRGAPTFACCANKIDAVMHHGPSLQWSPADFHARYGSDEDLLAIADAMLRMIASAARRGEYIPEDDDMQRLVRDLHREIVRA